MKVTAKKLKSLSIIFVALSVFALAACGGNSNNGSNGDGAEITLDFSHFYPPSHFMDDVVTEFVEKVEEETDGRIKISSYSGASLAEPDEHFDAAATGSVDIALSVHGYTPGEFPLSPVVELPFMSKTSMEGSTKLWQLYNEFDEFKDEYAGTVPLWLYTADPGHLHTVSKPVKSLEDLKGMRIRSPSPEASEWLEALGATPVSMPMNETYEALERGVVDGTIGSWEAVVAWGLDEVINYSTVGNFYNTTKYVVMNEDVWNSLSEEDQEIIREISEEMVTRSAEMFDEWTQIGIESADEKGVEVYELSEAELEEWKEYIMPTVENWIKKVEEKGLPGQEVYDRAIELSE